MPDMRPASRWIIVSVNVNRLKLLELLTLVYI